MDAKEDYRERRGAREVALCPGGGGSRCLTGVEHGRCGAGGAPELGNFRGKVPGGLGMDEGLLGLRLAIYRRGDVGQLMEVAVLGHGCSNGIQSKASPWRKDRVAGSTRLIAVLCRVLEGR